MRRHALEATRIAGRCADPVEQPLRRVLLAGLDAINRRWG